VLCRNFTLGAAFGVFATGEFVLYVGVVISNSTPWSRMAPIPVSGAAIEQQQMIFLARTEMN